jgi:hypothetical protein
MSLFIYLSHPYKFVTEWKYNTFDRGMNYLPGHLTIDSKGYIYIAYNTPPIRESCIQKFDSNGNFIERWESEDDKSGQYNCITDICTDSYDNIYIVDDGLSVSTNPRILKFNNKGQFLSVISEKEKNCFSRPGYYQIAADIKGNIFVTDSKSVQKIDSEGNFITRWRGLEGHASAIALDSNGNVYVESSVDYSPDTNTGGVPYNLIDEDPFKNTIWYSSVSKFDSSGKILHKNLYRKKTRRYPGIDEIALDSHDNLFMAGYSENDIPIVICDNKGNFIGSFGSKSYEKGQIYMPQQDIILDKENNAYILDREKHCVQKFSPKN